MANAPANRGFNVFDDFGAGGPSLATNAGTAAQLGANVVRIPVSWFDFQTGPNTYNPNALTSVTTAVAAARSARPGVPIKAVVIFSGPVPAWVQSQYPTQVAYPYSPAPGVQRYWAPRADGSLTDALGAFGSAAAQVLLQLPAGYADLIEIYNEPNGNGGDNNHPVGPIDPVLYGDMSAYAAYWVWNCVVNSNIHNANAHVLAGALSTISGFEQYYSSFANQQCSRLLSLDSTNYNTINTDVRISFHPYPQLDPNLPSSSDWAAGVQKVKDKVNSLISYGGNTHRYWVTEVAISSQTVGGGENQKNFARDVSTWLGGNSLVEGMLWFPTDDRDPLARDSASNFVKTGVYNASGPKPAGNWFATPGNWW